MIAGSYDVKEKNYFISAQIFFVSFALNYHLSYPIYIVCRRSDLLKEKSFASQFIFTIYRQSVFD